MPSVDRRLSVLFFVSGITGLIYEVVWAKHLTLLFGNTAHAHAVVLATFLGGLAIGNALLGPRADRATSPLRLYGYLEIAIGVFGGLSPTLLLFAGDVYVGIASGGLRETWGATLLRILLSSAVLLPPTILMGGTLPALSRYATRSLSAAERTVSWFYFLNASGAVVGCLAAGFLLIPQLGLNAGVWLAAFVNIAIGVIAWQISRDTEAAGEPVPDSTPEPEVAGATVVYGEREVRIAYVVIFVSGVVSLGFQIAWIRLLSLILGSSTYSFSLMVAAFIGGIAVGSSMIARRVYPKLNTFLMLGLAELGIAVAIIATMPLYERLPHHFAAARTILSSSEISYGLYEVMKLLVCLVVLLLPTTFIGMTVPLASRVAIDSVGNVGKKVGRVFSFNTVGNVIGAIAAGVFLLPVIGIQGLIWSGVAINAIAGTVILFFARWPRLEKLKVLGAAAAVALISTAISPGGWERAMLVNGSYRWRGAAPSFAVFKQRVHDSDLLFYQDGSDATVSVHMAANAMTTLRVNGKADASSSPPDMRTQLLLAHVPFILQPQAKSALVIGLGSGTTAGAALLYPVERVDVVEISQGVVDANRFFEAVNNKPLADERLSLHIEDAKGFLRLTDRSYDIIISEPSNPWIAGIGALFTAEFYREAHRHLRPEGLMAQWLHTYEIDTDSVSLILRTFAAEFPEVTVWELGGSSDLLLLGSNSPPGVDPVTIARRFAEPKVAESLASIGIAHPVTLLANQMGTTDLVRRLGGRGQLNEDLHPVLEYAAPKAFFVRKRADMVIEADQRLRGSEGHRLLVSDYLDKRGEPLSAAELRNMAEFFNAKGVFKLSAAVADEWLSRFPADQDAQFMQAKALVDAKSYAAATPLLDKLVAAHPENSEYLSTAAENAYSLFVRRRSVFSSGNVENVVAKFLAWEAVEEEKQAIVARRVADILVAEARSADAIVHIDRAISLHEARGVEGDPPIGSLYDRAIAIAQIAGATDRAIEFARRAVEMLPANAKARERLSSLEAQKSNAASQ